MTYERDPRCDYCGRRQDDSPAGFADADWNGETGCHETCEALTHPHPWTGAPTTAECHACGWYTLAARREPSGRLLCCQCASEPANRASIPA